MTSLVCFDAGLAKEYSWHTLNTERVALWHVATCCGPVSFQIQKTVQN